MSKNNSKNQSGIAPGNPDAYRNLFEQSLELLKKNYVPSERVLDLINEYTGKISKNHDYGHDSEFSMKVKSSLLLAALENIMAVQQSVQDELIKGKVRMRFWPLDRLSVF